MNLIDNILLLRKKYPTVWEAVKKVEDNKELQKYQIEMARNESPTLFIDIGNAHKMYVHSKYNPQNEAEKFINQFEVSSYNHILFYGIGLGYYVEELLRRYPNAEYSILEPSPETFYRFLQTKSISNKMARLPNRMVVTDDEEALKHFLYDFIKSIDKEILLIVNPVYEKIFVEQYQLFISTFREVIADKANYLHANLAFEKRWVLNSLKNLPITLKTPNFFEKKGAIQNKPVVLVSAGPSLQEEIDNLRYIKENGLAYIISVGSAINALIAYGIYPDATCSYDPKEQNVLVFQKMIDESMDNIPLIYGSTIGHESLQMYRGAKFHFVTDHDTILPFVLRGKNSPQKDIIHDAPSVAIVALQILEKINCSLVILVGQNLAYKDNRIYSGGIEYSHRSSFWTEKEENEAILVEDVYGNFIHTSQSFNNMRSQIEKYIEISNNLEVINTTNGGAKIKGTKFMRLSEVITSTLQTNVVDQNWLKNADGIDTYEMEHAKSQLEKLKDSAIQLEYILTELKEVSFDLSKAAFSFSNLQKLFKKFDRLFNSIQKNTCFKLLIAKMNIVQFDMVIKILAEARFEKDPFRKAQRISDEFVGFLTNCMSDLIFIREELKNVIKKIDLEE
ncbi:hypothetical protein AV540_26165 [Brevibacillus parabrevis]|uniref:motility associated factor glycosyltransferase family protein n=1 Tax=Brevibacillus parabrevis TaxID=54914 RepID=UPI0007AB7860|nr:6-hydroxymethylpterin diphosphokinase MptE-like protein [Brevibacillus parabrevis]KZE55740.1 hypothetical protein AV540_26165 [Brevibacillus parabrevis]